jgi:hypothetical protein
MKRKILFLLIIVGFVGFVAGIIKLIDDRSPKQGVLKINSDPVASVFLDNKHLGRTPYEDRVNEGEYEIKLVPESTTQSISSWQGKVKVAKNLLTYVNANLSESEFQSGIDILWLEKISSSKSELAVLTNPDGATVSLDGEKKGVTPITLSDIIPGDHTVAIDSIGFAPRTTKIKTTAGYKLIVSMKLALSSTDMLSPVSSESATATSSAKLTPTPSGKVIMSPSPSITPTKVPTNSTPTESITPDVSPTSVATGGETNPTKPYVTIKDTPTGYLNVRDNPATSGSNIVGKVYPSEKYTILETQNGWYQIKYDGTNTGWISGTYANKVE